MCLACGRDRLCKLVGQGAATEARVAGQQDDGGGECQDAESQKVDEQGLRVGIPHFRVGVAETRASIANVQVANILLCRNCCCSDTRMEEEYELRNHLHHKLLSTLLI